MASLCDIQSMCAMFPQKLSYAKNVFLRLRGNMAAAASRKECQNVCVYIAHPGPETLKFKKKYYIVYLQKSQRAIKMSRKYSKFLVKIFIFFVAKQKNIKSSKLN